MIIILVQAGAPVDAAIAALSGHLEAGDLIVDGGNEWFPNTLRRGEELAKKSIMFMGMGVSGGEVVAPPSCCAAFTAVVSDARCQCGGFPACCQLPRG